MNEFTICIAGKTAGAAAKKAEREDFLPHRQPGPRRRRRAYKGLKWMKAIPISDSCPDSEKLEIAQ